MIDDQGHKESGAELTSTCEHSHTIDKENNKNCYINFNELTCNK